MRRHKTVYERLEDATQRLEDAQTRMRDLQRTSEELRRRRPPVLSGSASAEEMEDSYTRQTANQRAQERIAHEISQQAHHVRNAEEDVHNLEVAIATYTQRREATQAKLTRWPGGVAEELRDALHHLEAVLERSPRPYGGDMANNITTGLIALTAFSNEPFRLRESLDYIEAQLEGE